VANGAAEQLCILADEAEGAADLLGMMLTAVEAIDQIGSLGRLIETAQYASQCRLARGDATDDADPLARLDRQVDVRERILARIGIAEADMLHLDLADADVRNDTASHEAALVRSFGERLQRLHRLHRLASLGHQERELADRRHRAAGQ